jgi:hypothetical protein
LVAVTKAVLVMVVVRLAVACTSMVAVAPAAKVSSRQVTTPADRMQSAPFTA